MTAAQQSRLCRTDAHIRTIAFDECDPASALLLTDRHRLHARLEEAHGLHLQDDSGIHVSPALGTALTALPCFATLRVLSLQLRGHHIPDAFSKALPRGLHHLTCVSTLSSFPDAALDVPHLEQLQVCLPAHHKTFSIIIQTSECEMPWHGA